MANFTVNPGAPDTVAKTVSNNDLGTILAGGTLSDTTDITWTGGTATSTVVINNSGTITATTRGIGTSGTFSTGSFTLNNKAGAKLIASGNDAFQINTNISNGTITVDNAGLLVSGAVDGSGNVIASSNGGQALDFQAITAQTAIIKITNEAGATIGASHDDAIRPGAGHIDIENSGLIDATASGNRAINLNTTNLSNVVSFTLNNFGTGTIQSQGDAVRITATTLSGNPTGTFSVDNFGTIKSIGVGSNNGQAIDFNDLVSSNGHVTITNEAGGLIQAADADAVRAGTSATVNNFGAIKGLNGTPTSTGNDGIDFQASAAGGIVNNGDVTHTTATIEGAAHGITGQQAITVNNWGTITGDLGSGVNMDTPSLSVTLVTNHGTIIGSGGYINNDPTMGKDGDGIDVDGLLNLDNFGTVQATGVHVVEMINGVPVVDLQEAVTIGGGSITNEVGGVITSFERAITVNDSDGTGGPPAPNGNGDNHGNGFAPTAITNWGFIYGGNGEAISITDTFNDTITNHGTIEGSIVFANGVGTSSGDDTISNYGTIDGAVSTADGNDILNKYTGSSISGLFDGGAGDDTVNLLGSGTGTLANVANVENLHVQGGQWTITDDESFTSGTTIDMGAALVVGNGGTTGSLTSDVLDNGLLTFNHSDTVSFANTISGSGAVEQVGNGALALSGHNSYSGGTEVAAGTLDVVATDSAGTGAITLDAGAQTLRIEQTALTAGDIVNTIDGLASDDTIDLAGIGVATHATLGANNVLTVAGAPGSPVTLHLDPNQNFTGDVFKVASDNAGGTNVMVAPDQAPVAQDGSASGDEDNGINGQAVAVDPDSLPLPLSYSVIAGPQHGQLQFNTDGTFTYAPGQDFNGSDSFTFKANDGSLDSNTATISLTINPVNDAPNFTSSPNFTVAENHTAVGTVTAVDPEHDAFTFALAGGSDQAFFAIDAHSGALSFINSPDFETPEDTNHDDVYDLSVSATDVFGASSVQTIHVSVTDLAEPGQTIHGGNGNDTLTGTTGNDTIDGGNGNDAINGGDGNDNLSGGNGDDVITGGRGDDLIDGGNGDDTLDGGVGNNQITGGNGNDIIRAADGTNNIDGGNGDDRITVGNGNNTISGGNGNDTITAGNGNNAISGGNGSDTVTVGNGNNSIIGSNGNDVIHVGTGNNTLTGGNGNDTFAFEPGFGKNTITDFSHGDHVEFDGGVFAGFAAVQMAIHQVGADTVIGLDANHAITLAHVTATSLHASDFIIA